jgi:hypothetical protein
MGLIDEKKQSHTVPFKAKMLLVCWKWFLNWIKTCLLLSRRKVYREEDYLSEEGPAVGTVADPAGALTDRSRDSVPRGPTESEVSIDVSDTEL